MTKVEIYLIVLITANLVASLCCHGKPVKPHNFLNTLSAMVVALPVYGRIFGWW